MSRFFLRTPCGLTSDQYRTFEIWNRSFGAIFALEFRVCDVMQGESRFFVVVPCGGLPGLYIGYEKEPREGVGVVGLDR